MNKSLNRNFVKGDLQYASSTQSIIGALVENETITPRQVQKKVLRRAPSTQVVIAALNEEKGIGLTISELNHTLKCPKILVVDGKST